MSRIRCNRPWEDFWVPGALILGFIVGLLAPSKDASWGARASAMLGWMYFCAWSVSFYPQVFLNWKRRSVTGLSLEYQLLNVVGFAFYFVFNASLFWSPGIRAAYREEHDGNNSAVRLNDVVFAGHACLLTMVTLAQIGVYWDYPPLTASGRVLRLGVLLVLAMLGAGVIVTALVLGAGKDCCMGWLHFLEAISVVKVIISVVKYCPQVWSNFQRKSTEGWTIHNVLLDLSGGFLSVAQLILDAGLSGDWSAISGDPAKFMLGNVSVFFDVIFIVQHYCLYGPKAWQRAQPLDSPMLA
eukprot:TRINITY_DN105339_c0_g1_i1.p1 TRINITY_DN105339_c0_g1~~TRINITY_DN105339_c0_g1_i1.p1  ORF type:complete len:306 (+),score=47.34 TRINITY_DN105339_c0_g1_i1:25-918(+)